MRIGIDCRLYSQTGVGRYIRAILAELKNQVLDEDKEYVLFVYKPDVKHFANFPRSVKIVVTSVKWHSFAEQIIMPFLLYREKLDLVHFPYFNVPIFYFKKFVVTIHDLTINKFKTGKATNLPLIFYYLKLFFYHLLMYFAVKRACRIITVSQSVREEIIKTYNADEEKVRVVYNGGELEEELEERGNHGNRGNEVNGEKYILYVGNLHPHKNLKTLILAYDELLKDEKYQDIKLIIVSPFDFFYLKLFDFLKNLKLENKVVFTGPVKNYKLHEFYKNAVCFVFPSFSEGFGIPGVEAMSLGCPVVASDIPVFHEVYASACLFFKPNNPVDLKEKIEIIINNPQKRSDLISLGLTQAKHFSWDLAGKEILKIYESCLSL